VAAAPDIFGAAAAPGAVAVAEHADEDQDHGDAERGDARADEDGVSTFEVAPHHPESRERA
jgi:hypothetical protein